MLRSRNVGSIVVVEGTPGGRFGCGVKNQIDATTGAVDGLRIGQVSLDLLDAQDGKLRMYLPGKAAHFVSVG